MNNEKDIIDNLIYDEDFIKLVKLYQRPNFFRVMGKSYREEWHSSFLCWLLNPAENHGLGTIPLKSFFELYSRKQDGNSHLADADISLLTESDYGTFHFSTEHLVKGGRIDIFGKSEKAVLVIENKVTSKEHDNQTERYYNYVSSAADYKNSQKYYVYLTIDKNDTAQDSHYIHITYQDIYDYVISRCMEHEDLHPDTKMILEQYSLNLSNPLNTVVMAHTNKPLCEKIYNRHQAALELIKRTMGSSGRDENSYVCREAEKYFKYLNEILRSAGRPDIVKINTDIDRLNGKDLLRALCENGIIQPGETEFILERYDMTFIVQVVEYEGEYKCISGYCKNYDGEQMADAVSWNGMEYFSSLTDAVDTAVMVYKHSKGDTDFDKKSGPGSTPLRELHSKKSIDDLKEELKEKWRDSLK